jgi:hypothetical protein
MDVFIGFDSTWTENPKAPCAIAAIGVDAGRAVHFDAARRLDGRTIGIKAHRLHREEISRFAAVGRAAEVGFHAVNYWLATWAASPSDVAAHASAMIKRFKL